MNSFAASIVLPMLISANCPCAVETGGRFSGSNFNSKNQSYSIGENSMQVKLAENKGVKQWERQLYGDYLLSCASDSSTIYLVSGQVELVASETVQQFFNAVVLTAVDHDTGEVLWQKFLDSKRYQTVFVSADGALFVLEPMFSAFDINELGSVLTRVDPVSGKTIWQKTFDDMIRSISEGGSDSIIVSKTVDSAIDPDSQLRILELEHHLISIDKGSEGLTIGKGRVFEKFGNIPMPHYKSKGHWVFQSDLNSIRSVSVDEESETLWNYVTSENLKFTSTESHVYVTDESGVLVVLDIVTGESVSEHIVECLWPMFEITDRLVGLFREDEVVAFDLLSKEVVWSQEARASAEGDFFNDRSPYSVLSSDGMLAFTSDTTIKLADAESGEVKWTHELDRFSELFPMVDGSLVAATQGALVISYK